MERVATVGELRRLEYRCRPVKQELRENLISHLRSGEPVFPGIIGYDDTVIPQLVNAILSRHDVLLLGLRGQAKTRIIRMISNLLDEWTPTLAGSDLPDDPLDPKLGPNRRILDREGDAAAVRWLHRSDRFHEKLATPDVTIGDLIGEIDLVRHAEGRRLADEEVIHYGLIPRTNRGIFAINELPDLPPRIQVGLFNALEERDVQIRGFPVRWSLDLFMAFTANPEDYTNRGRIVTPLKDRIGSVVRTHYPSRIEDGLAITLGSAWVERNGDHRRVEVPRFMLEVIEEFARIARVSPHVNQQSGVSVRASIANAELLVSNAERRCIRFGEDHVVPRVTDLLHVAAGCRGKIELLLAEDDRSEDKLIASMTGEAIKSVFERYGSFEALDPVVQAFTDKSTRLETGDDVPTRELAAKASAIAPLKIAAEKLSHAFGQSADCPARFAATTEFILEALYVNNRLSKYRCQGRTVFKR